MTHRVEGAHPLDVKGSRAERGQADIDQPDLDHEVEHSGHEFVGLRRQI
jgi:hypothetical protein